MEGREELSANKETSRTSICNREDCDRMRLLGDDLDGTGYQPVSGSVATLSGIYLHEGFAHLLKPEDPGDIDGAVWHMQQAYKEAFDAVGLRQAQGEDTERIRTEQMWMLELMVRGWHLVRYPVFMEHYRVVSVERQWRWQMAPGIIVPLRMDAVVERHDDGLIHPVDFKGAGSVSTDWEASHEISRQTIIYLTALEEQLGRAVGGMLYEGIVRGSFRKDTAKKSPFYGQRIQNTPLCYGYRKRDPENGLDQWRATYSPAAGWERAPAWEAHTPQQWLSLLDSQGVLRELFIAGDPVNPPPDFRLAEIRSIAHQEKEWFQGLELFERMREAFRSDTHPTVQDHLEKWAPRKTGRCNKYGEDHRCPFAEGGLCYLANATELLPEEPGFAPRIPHHAPATKEENAE